MVFTHPTQFFNKTPYSKCKYNLLAISLNTHTNTAPSGALYIQSIPSRLQTMQTKHVNVLQRDNFFSRSPQNKKIKNNDSPFCAVASQEGVLFPFLGKFICLSRQKEGEKKQKTGKEKFFSPLFSLSRPYRRKKKNAKEEQYDTLFFFVGEIHCFVGNCSSLNYALNEELDYFFSKNIEGENANIGILLVTP